MSRENDLFPALGSPDDRRPVGSSILSEVGTEGTGGQYIQANAKETILPHTTRTGGIEGQDKPYPPIRMRTFNQDGTISERTLFTGAGAEQPATPAATAQEPDEPVPPDPPAETPPEEPSEADIQAFHEEERRRWEAEEREAEERDRGRAQRPPALREDQQRRMLAELVRAELGRVRTEETIKHRPKPAAAPPPEESAFERLARSVTVRFAGSFGEIAAPFARVVAGDGCLILFRDLSFPYGYCPPADSSATLEVRWAEGQTIVEKRAVNIGLGFDYDKNTRAMVLILAED